MPGKFFSRFSSRTRLIAFAIVAVMLPTTVLSVIQYNSLADLEQKTKVAVRENLSQILQGISRQVAEHFKMLAKESLISVEGMNPGPGNADVLENHFASIKQKHKEIDRIFLVCDCTCDGEEFALMYSSEGSRRIAMADFKKNAEMRTITDAYQRAVSARPRYDSVRGLLYDQSFCGTVTSRCSSLQTTVFYPLARSDAEPPYGFVGMALDSNYLKETVFPRAVPEMLQCPLNGAGELAPELALYVFDENGETVLTHNTGSGQPEAKAWFAPLFPKWKLAIGYKNTTVEALAKDNFQKSLMLSLFVLSLLILGIILILRATSREMKLAHAKSTFVSNVSHELKTPLALIRLFAETLELGRVRNQEKAQEYYRIINNESRRLTQLINNILDFSKIEAGRKEYEFAEADIAEVVEEVLRSYEYQITSAGFKLITDIEHDTPAVMIDQDAISQALLNLLNNAVKYSDEVKEISVRVRKRDGHVAVEVADRGIGIPRSEHEKVFEKFYRVSTGLVHNTKGTGLGLALVKHIVEAHRGQILLDSAPGKGSRFTMLIPAGGSARADREIRLGSGGYAVAENPNS
ncbi:MAG: HAMP domain-containing sensor histidine kinase [Acidobacteriota bacterium]